MKYLPTFGLRAIKMIKRTCVGNASRSLPFSFNLQSFFNNFTTNASIISVHILAVLGRAVFWCAHFVRGFESFSSNLALGLQLAVDRISRWSALVRGLIWNDELLIQQDLSKQLR